MKALLKVIFFCILFLYLGIWNLSAQNLVPNHSFESIQDCDLYFDELSKATGWKGYNFTPDVFNVCAKNKFLGVPFNIFDRQPAASGKGYAGLLTYHKEYPNEVIGVKLKEPLRKGQKYKVSFKTSRAKSHALYATNNLGVLFTNTPEKAYNSKKVHINYTDVLYESEVWVTISGVFEADNDYSYLTIGNFFDKETTKIEKLPEGAFEAAYYFIDDVSVIKTTEKATPTANISSDIKNVNEAPQKENEIVISLGGKVMDADSKRPLVAIVEYQLPNSTYKKEYETDYITGQYAFTNVKFAETADIKITARNYYTVVQKIHTQGNQRIKKDFYLHPLLSGEDIELDNVSFKSGQYELEPESYEELNRLLQVLKDNPTMKIQLSGFTDDKNQTELAQKRAKAIKEYLVKIGKIDEKRISTKGTYETNSSKFNGDAADSKPKVERVEFKILN